MLFLASELVLFLFFKFVLKKDNPFVEKKFWIAFAGIIVVFAIGAILFMLADR
jgi:hypothetical protein